MSNENNRQSELDKYTLEFYENHILIVDNLILE